MINEVQVGRFDQLIKHLFDIKGEAPAPTLAPDLFAMFGLEMDRPEWGYLSGDMLWIGTQFDGAVAAQYSRVGIQNPANSNQLVVIYKHHIIGGGATTASLYYDIPGSAVVDSSGSVFSRDGRRFFNGGAFPRIVTLTSVGAVPAGRVGPVWSDVLEPTSNQLELDMPIVLAPGDGILWSLNTVNLYMQASFSGRWRVLNESEV